MEKILLLQYDRSYIISLLITASLSVTNYANILFNFIHGIDIDYLNKWALFFSCVTTLSLGARTHYKEWKKSRKEEGKTGNIIVNLFKEIAFRARKMYGYVKGRVKRKNNKNHTKD